MATVIDELIIAIGLDPKKLTKGQAQAVASFKKTQEDVQRISNAMEEAGRKVVNTLEKIRSQFISFTTAALEATGVEEFFRRMISTDVAVGNLARGLGVATEELSKWQIAVRLAGGDAADADQAIDSLVQQINLMRIDPAQATHMLTFLRALSGASGANFAKELADVDAHKVGAITNLILKMAQAGNAGGARSISLMTTFFRQMGFSQGFINLITRSPDAIRAFLAEAERIGPITDKDRDAALRFNEAWVNISGSLTRFFHNMVTLWGPTIAGWLDYWGQRAEALGNILEGAGVGALIGSVVPGVGTLAGAVVGGATSAVIQGSKGRLSSTVGLPLKAGATGGGETNEGLAALMRSLTSSEPALKEITALNDLLHKGTSSKHAQGLAGDFTLADPSHSAEVVARLRRSLAGVDAMVRDEYLNPSARSTGGHIHVQFNTAEAARRYLAMTGAASSMAAATGRTTNNSVSSEVNIGNVNVNAGSARDPQGIGRGIRTSLDSNLRGLALPANSGAN
jgi:hypothetical protein